LAKDLGAKKTLARINNAEYLKKEHKPKFTSLGVDELIYPETLAAKEIIASVKQPGARVMHEFSGGKLILFGIKIRDNAEIVNKSLSDIARDNISIQGSGNYPGRHHHYPKRAGLHIERRCGVFCHHAYRDARAL
jgi:Trk K+ transport system NAD-binding subunit